MSDTLQNIEHINNCLKWIKQHKPEDYSQRFLQLVEERRKLKQIAEAEENNPGIAAFGQSQVGKSYLIGCLLKNNDGKPFMVKADGKEYDFVADINPPSDPGGGVESTGVISRFSSFSRNPELYCEKYPVLIKTFSLTDLILILADSYYHDIGNFKQPLEKQCISFCDNIVQKYSTKQPTIDPQITADDVLFMKEYFSRHIPTAQVLLAPDIVFFDRIAAIIENVPSDEYVHIFSELLWNNNDGFTQLYNKLYAVLKSFDFARYLYLPIEAVLHHGVRENTIMSVQCFASLFNASTERTTDVYIRQNGQHIKAASNIAKSLIAAICLECIFKIEDDFLSSFGKYDFSYIKDDVINNPLLPKDEISMSMLRDNDLLDFPGARSRGDLDMTKISVSDAKEVENLMKCFLRGKVAYLFNQYNDKRIINILLFCHNHKNSNVSQLPSLLNGWITNYLGKTPEDRAKIVQITKVPPLFYIGTMFNLDLEPPKKKEDLEKATDSSVNDKWKKRFNDVTNADIFARTTYDWVNNFTQKNECFYNNYVIRDFKYSCPTYGFLYDGFFTEQKETRMLMTADYYDLLRRTFIKNEYCKQFFKDPALSFDVAASMNNDGALWLLQNLTIAAQNIGDARKSDFAAMTQKANSRVTAIMRQYYVSDDSSELLKENIRKADEIFREIEIACQRCPEYFGHLLSELQLSETESFRYLHTLIPKLGELVNNPNKGDYELIRKRCHNFEGCKTESDKWNVIIKEYRFDSQDAAEKFLTDKQIKVSDLFKGDFIKRTNSAVITDSILKSWRKRFSEAALRLSNNGTNIDKMDTTQMVYLTDCLTAAALFVKLSDKIEKAISPFVDILDITRINEYFVADMIASMVSSFVMDFGYSYLGDEQVQSAKRITTEQHLPAFRCIEQKRTESYDEEAATKLFSDILSLSGCFTPAYTANYNSWLEYMYIAFVANLNVPDYDRDANDKLKTLLEALKQ